MKLISLELVGKGENGWSSEELKFGKHITHLWGPNGCGKTPIVQSLAFCLGFPCIFRQDIYDRVNYARLKLEINGQKLSIKRVIGRTVDIHVIENSKIIQNFYNEDEYSEYLFNILGFERPSIVSTRNKAIKPYLSTLLPLIYLDQDDGYRSHYHSKSAFIKDQFEEMMRVAFSLPPKNSFDQKKQKILEKENLERIDRAVNIANRRYNSQKTVTEEITKPLNEIYDDIKILDEELENLKSSHSNHDDSVNALDKLINTHKRSINIIDGEINDLHLRNQGVDNIIAEINTEVDTLNLNEESRRVFINSTEICSSSNCGMFSSSSESYSKNLLYLKDQIKDLERNSNSDKCKIEELERRKAAIKELVQNIIEERNIAIGRTEASILVNTISEIKNQLFLLRSQYEKMEELDRLEKECNELNLEQNRVIDRVNSLSVTRNPLPKIIKLKSRFKDLLIKWLSAIGTINVSLDIRWKNEFIPYFGVESIGQIKGSTRARVVLAYHAALIELLLEFTDSNLRFIILDTPKQHEIHDNDLDNFMTNLKELCKKHSLQVVFSTTGYKYLGDKEDTCWIPSFSGPEQNMFLTTKRKN